jgi:hypothetical protein
VKRSWLVAGAIVLSSAGDARADQAHQKNVWEKLKGGHDLVESVPTAAVFDGMWSLYVHFATELTNRTWDAPCAIATPAPRSKS